MMRKIDVLNNASSMSEAHKNGDGVGLRYSTKNRHRVSSCRNMYAVDIDWGHIQNTK